MAYYAVACGRKTGVFRTWAETKAQVDGFAGARFKKFDSQSDAENFVKGGGSIILGQFGISLENVATNATLKSTSSPHLPDALVAFTDGACSKNGSKHAKAGWAVVFPNHENMSISGVVTDHPTNNRAEYMALCKAFDVADQIDPKRLQKLIVYTDSKLLKDSLTKWLPGWKRNHWKKSDGGEVLNRDLLEKLDGCMQRRAIEMHHVLAHTGRNDWMSVWNDKVDRMARDTIAT